MYVHMMYMYMYLHILTRLSPPPVTSLFVEEELGTLELPWVNNINRSMEKEETRQKNTENVDYLIVMFTHSLTHIMQNKPEHIHVPSVLPGGGRPVYVSSPKRHVPPPHPPTQQNHY